MNNLRTSTGLVGIAVIAALPCMSAADTYFLRRDNVIPVVFVDKLTIRDNRPGDTFLVRVGDTDQLPRGTQISGRIDRIHPPRGNRPASMDLRFTDILLPDGSRVPVDASPLPLDDKYITRTGDGRIIAKQNLRQQQGDVLGGAIGGFIVGSIFHRRIVGTIIGTMIGVGAAASEREKNNNLIANPGDKVGALFNHDVQFDFLPVPPGGRGGEPGQLDQRYRVNQQLDRAMANPVRGAYRSDIDIVLRGKHLSFPDKAQPYRIGKNVMVPLDVTAKQLRLSVDRQPGRTINVNGPTSSLQLTISSRQARLDGKRFDLPRTVWDMHGVIYVPIDALAPLVKDDLIVNGTKFVGDGG